MPLSENRVYYPALDGLRAVAVLMVFAEHYLSEYLPKSEHWGWTGVDLFFVLSGFLITGILYDTRDDTHRVRTFYVRRTLRIFPLYYGVLLALVLSTPIFQWAWTRGSLLWPLYLGNYLHLVSPWQYLPGQYTGEDLFSPVLGVHALIGHFWSLCVEEQFYLFWPWVVFLVRKRETLLKICIAAAVVCPLLRLIALHLLPGQLISEQVLNRATPFRIDSLLIGAGIALILRGAHAQRLLRFAWAVLAASVAAWLVTWIIFRAQAHSVPRSWHDVWFPVVGYSYVDLIGAGLVLLAIRPGNAFYNLCSSRPLQWLGRRSYGFYVFHYLPGQLYISITPVLLGGYHKHLMYFTALNAMVCSLVLCGLSYKYFEAPILRLKDRFTVQCDAQRSVQA